jgi:hypothetical protein
MDLRIGISFWGTDCAKNSFVGEMIRRIGEKSGEDQVAPAAPFANCAATEYGTNRHPWRFIS